MEIKRLTIKNGKISFYGNIYNKCSNKNDPKIAKQKKDGKRYCDIIGYKYKEYSYEELCEIYKKLSLIEDVMEKNLIETPEMLDIYFTQKHNVDKMFQSKVADLETKLAEKEKEIETLKKCGDTDHFYGLLEDKKREIYIYRKHIEKQEQDKISFAVEKLEELKKFTEKEIKECNKLLQEEFEDDYYIQSVNARQSMCYEFKREIDNQIKQLKEGE